MKKQKIVYAVFHTTENGADYLVKSFSCKENAFDYINEKKAAFDRELILRTIRY